MKFNRFQFNNYWGRIVLIPTIVIDRNDPIYCRHNFSIELHWLGWHCRWQWIEEEVGK